MASFKATRLAKSPISIHLLVTDRCNLDCEGCFYEGNGESIIELSTLRSMFEEWEGKVKSVAIGGGEPLLHPDIEEIIEEANAHGFYTAVTTNGTILKPIEADRLHVSHDEIHETEREDVDRSLDHYRRKAGVLGINHIVRSIEGVLALEDMDVDTLTFLLEKPKSGFDGWRELFGLEGEFSQEIWYDACLARLFDRVRCRQGYASMSIATDLTASPCSNVDPSVPYEGLEKTWRKVRKLKGCPVPEKRANKVRGKK